MFLFYKCFSVKDGVIPTILHGCIPVIIIMLTFLYIIDIYIYGEYSISSALKTVSLSENNSSTSKIFYIYNLPYIKKKSLKKNNHGISLMCPLLSSRHLCTGFYVLNFAYSRNSSRFFVPQIVSLFENMQVSNGSSTQN